MAEERVQRRLAAILAADVVDYSRFMEADEAGTLARGAGIRSSHQVQDIEAFEDVLEQSLASEGPHFIVAIVEPSEELVQHPSIDDFEKRSGIRIDEVENRYRFIRSLEGLEGRHILEYPADIRPKTS